MNMDCNGDFFTAESVRYYRCLLDGAVLVAREGEFCGNCGRRVDAADAGVLPVEAVKFVTLPSFGQGLRVLLPPNAKVSGGGAFPPSA